MLKILKQWLVEILILLTQTVILIRLIQTEILTRLTRKTKRELLIILTVLAGMLAQHLLFHNNNELSKTLASLISEFYHGKSIPYYTHLTLNFLKSFLVLILCYHAILITDSKRLFFGLITFLIFSMIMDLSSIISTEAYYNIKPYRYTNNYNFKDSYYVFEILCLLYSFTKCTLDFIRTALNNYIDRIDVLRNTPSMEAIQASSKNEINTHG